MPAVTRPARGTIEIVFTCPSVGVTLNIPCSTPINGKRVVLLPFNAQEIPLARMEGWSSGNRHDSYGSKTLN